VLAVTTPVFHRRSAERFAKLIDQSPGEGPRHRARSRLDDDLSALVALSQQTAALRLKLQTAGPDPAFRTDLRAMLVATAEREGIGAAGEAPADAVVNPSPSRSRLGRPLLAGGPGSRARVGIIAGVAIGALALSGISATSGDATPGDSLYGVKRSTERAELALAGSDIGRGQLFLEFARTRLSEARAVSADAASFALVLRDMDSATRQGVKLLTTAAVDRHDPAALDAVDWFVTAQRDEIGGLLDKVAGGSRTRLLNSLGLVTEVGQRSQQLRVTMSCGATASDGSDPLGPRPRSC
jgi:hypothetical protein